MPQLVNQTGLSEAEVVYTILKLPYMEVAIDIGALYGRYTKLLATKAKQVIAIEPDEINYKILQDNTKNDHNILVLKAAIAETNGYRDYMIPGGTSQKVRCITIDELLSLIDKKIDLIKVDVEGAEFDVLDSCTNFKDIKSWIIELHDSERRKELEIRMALEEGYNIKWLDGNHLYAYYAFEYRPSKIHGMGVFTTCPIKKGEYIPSMGNEDFKGSKGQGYNHSYSPNFGWNEDFTRLVAYRDILKDEELTINYIRGWMKQGLSKEEAERRVVEEIADTFK